MAQEKNTHSSTENQESSPPGRKKNIAELTIRAVILGVILAVVMGAANVYLGLKAGMTVSASIPAAVIAMLILRGLFRNGTILEANQVQTAASAGESLAAGIIFTMPALILIGVWQEFDFFLTTIIAFTGGLLGILFMIPMRRVFVKGDQEELKFPEGVACAAVLEAGEEKKDGPSEAINVVKGALIGGAFKLLASFAGLIKNTLEGAFFMVTEVKQNVALASQRIFYFGSDISPALVAVGFIVRLNVALLIFIGGALGWLVGIPLLSIVGETPEVALDGAWDLWSSQIRYVGVGAMVVGGIASIVKVRHGLVQAVQEIRKKASKTVEGKSFVKDDEIDPDLDRDIPSNFIMLLGLLASALVGFTYYILTKDPLVAGVTTVIMLVMSFFFSAVASYIVGLVGNSNSPVSGMTITAVLFTGGMLLLFGFAGTEGMVATLGVAAIVCCVACTSGDVCNDLKTGAIVGAKPYKQQIIQIAGVAAAALVMAPILQLLHEYTPGGIGGKELAAPQAGLFAALAKGFFGDGELPWQMVQIGAIIGALILVIDHELERRRSSFRAHLMPIAVGMYLPFGLTPPILLGGLLAHLFSKGVKDEKKLDKTLHRGVLFSSGIIAGESLMGVAIAILAALGINRLSLEESPASFLEFLTSIGITPDGLITLFTLIAAFAILYAFHRASKPKETLEED